jgi:hypothetical protein
LLARAYPTSRSKQLARRRFAADIKVVAVELPHADERIPPPLFTAAEKLMAVVAQLQERQAVLLAFPKSLYPRGALLLVTEVVPECALDTCGHVVPVSISHVLESEQLRAEVSYVQVTNRNTYGLWVLDESFGDAHLPLFSRDAGVFQDLLASCLRIALPNVVSGVRCGGRQKVESGWALAKLTKTGAAHLSTIFSNVFRYANPARLTRMFSCRPRYLI